jgi:hypothetical protein
MAAALGFERDAQFYRVSYGDPNQDGDYLEEPSEDKETPPVFDYHEEEDVAQDPSYKGTPVMN